MFSRAENNIVVGNKGLRLICWAVSPGCSRKRKKTYGLSRDPEIALQGMARISNQQEYIAADDAYLKLIDHPLNKLIGSDWKSNIHPRDIPRAVHAFQDMRLSGIGDFMGM